jgi:hypothetical protein
MRHVLAAMLLLTAPARADWLTWDDDMPNGNPAITYNANGDIAVTMSSKTLLGARASGLKVEQVVAKFLGRYAPGMCSNLVDMNKAHQNLKVELFLQHPDPNVDQLFVVEKTGHEMQIDYIPEKPAKCVEPFDAVS